MKTERIPRSVAALLLLVGASCADHPLLTREPGEPALASRGGPAEVLNPSLKQTAALLRFADLSVVPGATATLLRHTSGIRFTVQTSGIPAGEAVTVWWVVFNHPDKCQHPVAELMACSEPDLFSEEVGATVLFGAGHVIGGSGTPNFAASLRVGDLSGCQPPFGEFGLCRDGLTNPGGSEVHLVVRSHGAALPGMVREQIRTFAGGCTPETSFGAGTGPNACGDLQFAIIGAP